MNKYQKSAIEFNTVLSDIKQEAIRRDETLTVDIAACQRFKGEVVVTATTPTIYLSMSVGKRGKISDVIIDR
jgi:hypothetical protein